MSRGGNRRVASGSPFEQSIGHGDVFGEVKPAATMVIVAGLLDPRWKVEIEAEAERES